MVFPASTVFIFLVEMTFCLLPELILPVNRTVLACSFSPVSLFFPSLLRLCPRIRGTL